MRLFAERGFDGTTIVDIAEAADVAPRTVQLYFPCKSDIALSMPNEVADRLTATFRARPDLGFLAAVDLWLTAESEAFDPELAHLADVMYEANPDLRALGSTHIADAAHLGHSALAAEAELPEGHPMTAVISAAVGAALAQYFTTVPNTGPDSALHASFMACLRAVVGAARPTDAPAD